MPGRKSSLSKCWADAYGAGDKMKIEKVNLLSAVKIAKNEFEYVEVGTVNSLMLNVLYGSNRTLDFHVHEESDEMFYVISGSFKMELKEKIINLRKGDFIIIPKGTLHRPICHRIVKVLLIENKGTLNENNSGGNYKSKLNQSMI